MTGGRGNDRYYEYPIKDFGNDEKMQIRRFLRTGAKRSIFGMTKREDGFPIKSGMTQFGVAKTALIPLPPEIARHARVPPNNAASFPTHGRWRWSGRNP